MASSALWHVVRLRQPQSLGQSRRLPPPLLRDIVERHNGAYSIDGHRYMNLPVMSSVMWSFRS